MQPFFALLLAMGITVLLIPPLIQQAGRLGVLDQPSARKVHAQPIPRVGGIAMGIGLLAALLLWGEADRLLVAYCVATLLLLIFGMLDDRLELSPSWKLLGQLLVALIVMIFGDLNVEIVRHTSEFELPRWLSLLVTLFFIVGVTNAINLADGLDGLAGGTTLLCLSGLALLALTGGSVFVGLTALTVIGAVLGFLRYNTHPARVFMGDAGSQVLGFSAAVLSLALTQDRSLPYSAALPLLLLGVPVIDTLTVMIERVLDGKSPFRADRNHIHHRLLALGFDHHEAVMVIYGVQTALLVMAWYLRYVSDLVVLGVFAGTALTIVALLRSARTAGWRWRSMTPQGQPRASWLQICIKWLKASGRLNRWTSDAVCIAITAYVALILFNGADASGDIRLLAAAAAVFVLVGLLMADRTTVAVWLQRAALYVSAPISVFLDREGSIPAAVLIRSESLIFALLGLAIVLRLRMSADRQFRITPLDLLVLLVAVAVPNLPGSVVSGYDAGWMVLKVLLLFYGIETLSVTRQLQWRVLCVANLVFLSTVAWRSF